MAGLVIDLKDTIPFSEIDGTFHYHEYRHTEYLKDHMSYRELEKYKDDVLEPCEDIPHCFTPGPYRALFSRHRDFHFFSAYKPFVEHLKVWRRDITVPFDVTILMIADGTFAGGVYKEGNIIANKELVAGKSSKSSKSVNEDFRNKVKTQLKTWEGHLDSSQFVFVRCTYADKVEFFDGKGETVDATLRHIPFETGKPTLREVERVYDRLTRCIYHGYVADTIHFWETRCTVPSITQNHEERESNRRMEKKMWPWLDSILAKRLVEYVHNDNGNGLYDEVEKHPKKSELVKYLNSCHEKFNNGTFLHFAVQNEASIVTEILLELGCDPSIADGKNKVPFEYCRTTDVQEVFMKFRNENPELYNWNKAKIPENSNRPLHNDRRKEEENPKRKDVSKIKRTQKLEKKRIDKYE